MAVIDASVIVAAMAPDELLERALDMIAPYIAGGACVPSIWPIEVANALATKQRRGALSRQTALDVWQLAMDVPVTVIETTRDDLHADVLPLAFAQGLSTYDALYLHLARSRGIPLLTLDRKLIAACQVVGVITP
jgi:predicted nucleic acid-binding protein